MRCGKQEHQPRQKCPAKNAMCKDCHKIGHFHKVCQTKKRAKQRANLVQTPQDNDDTYIDLNGVRQPNPPRVNMLKLVNHIEYDKGGKHLKFPTASHPKGHYKHHIVVRVDTGADVNCMNEMTFNELFHEVQLSVCPCEIQNFGNSVADISIPGQFHTYLEFRGEKYLNIFIVTNANDCPNLLSHGATFRMGVLLPNYPEENVVKGDNMPNFSKMNGGRTGNGASHCMQNGITYVNIGNGIESGTPDGMSNVFQILNDIWKRQSGTVPVPFQYGAHSARDGNSFQDHHTLHTSNDSYDSKAGRFSTCTHTPSAKYFTEWTSSTLCICPQATKTGSQTRRFFSPEKSPAPAQ